MKLRISTNMHRRLVEASEKFNHGFSEIARKAVRKWNRLGASNQYEESTYNGTVVELDVPNISNLRVIIDWYLKLHEDVEVKTFIPKEKEGIDYVVVGKESV